MNGIGKLDDIQLLQPFLEAKNGALDNPKKAAVLPFERVSYISEFITDFIDMEFILEFIGRITGTELISYYNDYGELSCVGVIPLMKPMFPGMFLEAMQ
jgi:hypothetical protein